MTDELISRETVQNELEATIKDYLEDATLQGVFAAGVICDVRDNVISPIPAVMTIDASNNTDRLISSSALVKAFREYMVENHDREKCVSAENCDTCEPGCLWRRIISKAPAVEVVSMEEYLKLDVKHKELQLRHKRLLETAKILDDALREYQKKYGE